jgi:hypothetical protein
VFFPRFLLFESHLRASSHIFFMIGDRQPFLLYFLRSLYDVRDEHEWSGMEWLEDISRHSNRFNIPKQPSHGLMLCEILVKCLPYLMTTNVSFHYKLNALNFMTLALDEMKSR